MRKLIEKLILFVLVLPFAVFADGEIRFSNNAYKQIINKDTEGNTSFDYVDPGLVIPGDVIYYVIGFENISDKPAGDIVIDNPLPNNSIYRQGSAKGNNTNILFSVDGQTFLPAEQLMVADASGNRRQAKPEDYSHIRWIYNGELAPGQKSIVSYKTTIKKATE